MMTVPSAWRRSVELFEAWWTIHVSHADVAAYWETVSGIPFTAPGATMALAGTVQQFLQAQLQLTD